MYSQGSRKLAMFIYAIICIRINDYLKELLQVFSDESITYKDVSFRVVLPNGKQEKAIDILLVGHKW